MPVGLAHHHKRQHKGGPALHTVVVPKLSRVSCALGASRGTLCVVDAGLELGARS